MKNMKEEKVNFGKNYTGNVYVAKSGMAYAKRTDAVTSMNVSATEEWIEISMTEYRVESKRETGAHIVFTRQEWEAFKALIKKECEAGL